MIATATTPITADVEWTEEWLWDHLRFVIHCRDSADDPVVVDVTHAMENGETLPMEMARWRECDMLPCKWNGDAYTARLVEFGWHDRKALATYEVEAA